MLFHCKNKEALFDYLKIVKSINLHFHFLIQDCSFLYLIKMKKKETFEIEFSKHASAKFNVIHFNLDYGNHLLP